MPKNSSIKNKRRVERMFRLIERLRRSEQPLAYRRNRVTLHPDGPHFFRNLFDAIRKANRLILLEYYMIRGDSTGVMLTAELAEAVKRGVRVFLIYDYIGSVDTSAQFFRTLTEAGVELLAFNVPSFRRGILWFDRRDHRKMAIIDSRVAFLGGFNIGDEYAGVVAAEENFRDVGFSISGSAVGELERIFFETWSMEQDDPPNLPATSAETPEQIRRGQATVLIVSGGPHQRRSYIRGAFLAAIASASEEINIATPYFVPGPRIVRSLLRAVRRGVRVRLLFPAASDVPLMRLVGQGYYTALLRGGIEIFELERQILHAKLMVIDGERTVIGSANLDQRSFHRNFEINCIIDSRLFGSQIMSMLEHDFSVSRQVLLKGHEQRGLVTRLLEKLVNLFGWFL